ncbi:MAG: hypothetical protein JWO44_2522 [Bacteroidetes bacterium]|nr:hypothetical protein [Bacteroidota bacterium]
MKNTYVAICILLSGLFVNLSYSQGWEWRTLVTAGVDQGIVMDHSNRVYAYRHVNTSSIGGFSMDKLDVTGAILWSASISGDAMVTAVRVDAADNVLLLGNITSACAIQGQALIPVGSQSFFLVKLSPSGAVLSSSVYGSPTVTFANDLFITSSGDYLIGGASSGTFSMNGYAINGDTLQTCFLVKTDASQNVIWADKGVMTSGSSAIDEIAETTSGNYFMVLNMQFGFVDFNGPYTFSSGTGQYITYMNSARQIQSDAYFGYTGLSFFHPYKLSVINDNAYMKNQASHHDYAGEIYRWDPACVQTNIGWPGSNIGYSTLNGKVYFSIIEWNNSGMPNNFWRKLGTLSPVLAIEKQHVDSTGTDGADIDMQAIDTNSYYILEDESFFGVFVGKYNMSLAASVAGINKKSNPLSVYPNPASGSITVKGLEPGDELIRIYNPLGMLVFTAAASDPQIAIGMLPPAVYSLEAAGKNGIRRLSFVKQ